MPLDPPLPRPLGILDSYILKANLLYILIGEQPYLRRPYILNRG
jgi:hypothetical protein